MANWAAQARCKVAENCVRCLHGVGHPPLLAVFDPAAGGYVRAEGPACVARWASGGHAHGAGDICGEPADKTAAGIDLCNHHADRLTKWRHFEEPEERVRVVAEAPPFDGEVDELAFLVDVHDLGVGDDAALDLDGEHLVTHGSRADCRHGSGPCAAVGAVRRQDRGTR